MLSLPFIFWVAGENIISDVNPFTVLPKLRTGNLGSLSLLSRDQTLEKILPLFLFLPLRQDLLLDLLIGDLTSQRIPDNCDHAQHRRQDAPGHGPDGLWLPPDLLKVRSQR